MIKTFYPIRGFRVTADTNGTANQKTITIACEMEMFESEAKECMFGVSEALVWLKNQKAGQ